MIDIDKLIPVLSFLFSAVAITFTGIEMYNGRRRVKAEIFHRLQEHVFNINSFFAQNSQLRPYVYEAKKLPPNFSPQHAQYSSLIATAELVLDLFDTVCYQRNYLPEGIRKPWERYIYHVCTTSHLIQYFLFDETQNAWQWYTQYLIELLGEGHRYKTLKQNSTEKVKEIPKPRKKKQ